MIAGFKNPKAGSLYSSVAADNKLNKPINDGNITKCK